MSIKEGINIHYALDNKRLCSFRHILEDPTAPFKQCDFINKSNKQRCTAPIKHDLDRRFCNNHMQIMGLLPKKEKKPKDSSGEKSAKKSPVKAAAVTVDTHPVLPQQPLPPPCLPPDGGSLELGTLPNVRAAAEAAAQAAKVAAAQAAALSSSGESGFLNSSPLVERRPLEDRLKLKRCRRLERRLSSSEPETDDPYAFPDAPNSTTANDVTTALTSSSSGEMLKSPGLSASRPGISLKLGSLNAQSTFDVLSSPIHCKSGACNDVTPKSFDETLSGLLQSSSPPVMDLSQFLAGNANSAVPPPNTSLSDLDSSDDVSAGNDVNGLLVDNIKSCKKNRSSDSSGRAARSNNADQPQTNGKIAPSAVTSHLAKPPSLGISIPPSPSSIARMYPELAEKLERCKHNNRNDLMKMKSSNNRTSSRTMNALQTKIAQKRIKMRRRQNSASPGSSPLSSPSPSSGALDRSPAAVNIRQPHTSPGSRPATSSVTSSLKDTGVPSDNLLPSSVIDYRPGGCQGSQSTSRSSDVRNSSVHNTDAARPPPPYPGPPLRLEAPDNPPPNKTVKDAKPPRSRRPVTSKRGKVKADAATSSVASLPVRPKPERTQAKMKPALPVVSTRVRRSRSVTCEAEVRRRSRSRSVLRLCQQYLKQRTDSESFLHFAPDSDSDCDDQMLLPRQKEWYVPSSDEEDAYAQSRNNKLASLHSRMRRQCSQMLRVHAQSRAERLREEHDLRALLQTAQVSAAAGAQAVELLRDVTSSSSSYKRKRKRTKNAPVAQCHHVTNSSSEAGPAAATRCQLPIMPFANFCKLHITESPEQQLFLHCTAKFADNTQCSAPVFDLRHELPLCSVHAAKADNYQRENADPKNKKARKKPKPSALTRPPKRGKKRRKVPPGIRPSGKPIPELDDPDNYPRSQVVFGKKDNVVVKTEAVDFTHSLDTALPRPPMIPGAAVARSSSAPNDEVKEEKFSELGPPISPVELPLTDEQATNFLDDHDINEVLNKFPADAFDIFSGKSDELLPTKEEAEELERQLSAGGGAGSSGFALSGIQDGGLPDGGLMDKLVQQHHQQMTSPLSAQEASFVEKLSQEAALVHGFTPSGNGGGDAGGGNAEDDIAKQIAASILNQHGGNLDDDLQDDLTQADHDNISALASSLSVHDVKQLPSQLLGLPPHQVLPHQRVTSQQQQLLMMAQQQPEAAIMQEQQQQHRLSSQPSLQPMTQQQKPLNSPRTESINAEPQLLMTSHQAQLMTTAIAQQQNQLLCSQQSSFSSVLQYNMASGQDRQLLASQHVSGIAQPPKDGPRHQHMTSAQQHMPHQLLTPAVSGNVAVSVEEKLNVENGGPLKQSTGAPPLLNGFGPVDALLLPQPLRPPQTMEKASTDGRLLQTTRPRMSLGSFATAAQQLQPQQVQPQQQSQQLHQLLPKQLQSPHQQQQQEQISVIQAQLAQPPIGALASTVPTSNTTAPPQSKKRASKPRKPRSKSAKQDAAVTSVHNGPVFTAPMTSQNTATPAAGGAKGPTTNGMSSSTALPSFHTIAAVGTGTATKLNPLQALLQLPINSTPLLTSLNTVLPVTAAIASSQINSKVDTAAKRD